MKPSELIADPKHWTKRSTAVNSRGDLCLSDSPDAVAWCAIGACRKTMDGPALKWKVDAALTNLAAEIYDNYPAFRSWLSPNVVISRWNDAPERTHAEVIALLKSCDL